MGSRLAAGWAAAACAVALAGCGLGPGPGTSDVTVNITRAFGTIPVAGLTVHRVPGSETVMRVPQTEQYTHPACSTTEGTVLNLR